MTARELLQELQKLDEKDLDLPVWIQYKEQTGLVSIDKDIVLETEPTIWSTGELTVTICGERAIWKGKQP